MNPVENRKNESPHALNELDLGLVRGGLPVGPGPHPPEGPSGAPVPRFPRLPHWLRPIPFPPHPVKPPAGTTPPIVIVVPAPTA